MSVIERIGNDVRAHAVDVARRAGQVTVTETQAAASRRSGALAQGISATEPALVDTRVTQTITSAADYSQFQDEGTGIFGPRGARIFPTRARALRFDWPAAGGIVFAKSVAGSPGRHFFAQPMPQRWYDALAQSVGGPL